MESVESPLDVLSRAATMVQDSLPISNSGLRILVKSSKNPRANRALPCSEKCQKKFIYKTSNISDDTSKPASTKQLPTTKWKRERRRLPEYSRKSDPKLSDISVASLHVDDPSSPTETSAPLDMSVRQRGQPPSYTQAISSPGYRPSVITQAPTTLPSGISMCDPIIDEHFRRSLGKDYLTLFNNNKTVVVEPPPVIRDVAEDSAGLSVDDHFAKALGDTWLKLNQKEPEVGDNKPPQVVSLSL